jgi:methionyl aminopeptidase
VIPIKTREEILMMHESGKILAEVFEVVEQYMKTGNNAAQIDKIAYSEIIKRGAKPSFKGYRGYKYTTCISKNEEVVHGIPYENKIMMPGDICGVDIGVFYKGFHSDAARTYIIEKTDPDIKKLVDVTRESFFIAIAQAIPGNHLGDISHAMQKHVELHGFSMVRDLCSHGIGKKLHEEPLIPNYGKKGEGPELKEGMTFAIEPMVNQGKFEVLTLPDKWTIMCADKKWSSHYENTICITNDGPKILTMK